MLIYHGSFDVPLLSAYSRSGMAGTLLQQGKVAAAIDEARAAAQQAPESADIQAGLARILMLTGQTDEAQWVLATALHLARTIHPDYQAGLVRQLSQPPPR
jgi:thioredoxin-like negative regulator of GroEL